MSVTDVQVPSKYWGKEEHQELFAYNSDGLVEYKGAAAWGAATSDSAWIIWKFAYTNGLCVSIKCSQFGVIWDNRAASSVVYNNGV